jgi:hypothetical protein
MGRRSIFELLPVVVCGKSGKRPVMLRALPSEGRGQGFESLRVRQLNQRLMLDDSTTRDRRVSNR